MTQSAVPLPVLLAGMATAVALLVWPVLVPREPRFVYNPSASVAPGWYRIERLDRAGSLHVGSTVLVRLPADVAALAAQRGYLPSGVPMLKRVGALARNPCACATRRCASMAPWWRAFSCRMAFTARCRPGEVPGAFGGGSFVERYPSGVVRQPVLDQSGVGGAGHCAPVVDLVCP